MARPFRFGFQSHGDSDDPRDLARRAEAAGFDLVCTWDHVADGWSALAPLLAMADAAPTIRVCPMVINNDFHHPVHLAREVASIDALTGGRVELGIGAGHAFTEYAAIGQAMDPPAVRKRRLAESVEILRRLLDGEEVTFAGEHYRLDAVRTMRSTQARLPILVGVAGREALAHAARHADAIGLMGLGRTLADGQRHEVRWQPERLTATIDHIRASAGERFEQIELNALVQVVQITDDRRAAAARLTGAIDGLTVEDALATPFLALGTHDEIAEHLLACRERWGISNYTVRSIEDMAPVIARLRDGATIGA
ncbi:MAG: TIGR03621 family F420-dependent LLM class oxidoreductase [Ilumatobacteraceae bacterium]